MTSMPASCRARTMPLNSCTCWPSVAVVLVVRREEADRAVTPVVAQALLQQGVVLHELVHGHELDRGDPELLEVLDDRRVPDAAVGAAQLLGDPRMGHRQALDVGLVDDRL